MTKLAANNESGTISEAHCCYATLWKKHYHIRNCYLTNSFLLLIFTKTQSMILPY